MPKFGISILLVFWAAIGWLAFDFGYDLGHDSRLPQIVYVVPVPPPPIGH